MELLVTNHPQRVEKSHRLRPSQNLPAPAAATAATAVTRESGNVRVAGFPELASGYICQNSY